jgi:hypothetical protein
LVQQRQQPSATVTTSHGPNGSDAIIRKSRVELVGTVGIIAAELAVTRQQPLWNDGLETRTSDHFRRSFHLFRSHESRGSS